MARIRTIKPDFWTNAKILKTKPLARLMFIGMWNHADDWGRMAYEPATIRAQVFPGDDEVSKADVADMLKELNANGLILLYSVDDREYIEICGWDHQKIDRRTPSKIPAPFVEPSPSPRALSNLTVEEGSVAPARSAEQERLGNFCQAIVSAYAEANSPTPPDTSRAGLWLTKGYDPEICVAVIKTIVKRKPNAGLAYFDGPILEAHNSRAPPRAQIGASPKQDWDGACKLWKSNGRWPKGHGPDPDSPACQCPPEILEKYMGAA